MSGEQLMCKTHPSEYITNFCSSFSCHQELCATCISEHTQFHNQAKTKPEFQNIKETFSRTNEQLNKFKECLAKQKLRVKNLMETLDIKGKDVQKILKDAKDEVIALVDKTFEDLEKEFFDSLAREKQKSGLLNKDRLEEIHVEINRRSLEVYAITQEVNKMKTISKINKINSQILPKGMEFHDKIASEISKNEMFQATACYKPTCLEEVAGALKKLIFLSFSYPKNDSHRHSKNDSKTPIKDPNQQLLSNCNMNRPSIIGSVIPRPSQVMMRSPIQITRSPNKVDSRNRQSMFNGRICQKQNDNVWGINQEKRMFGNTFNL